MATNSSTLQERMSEARAASQAASLTRAIDDAVVDPSTKRFVKSRTARIERWQALADLALKQINALQAAARVTTKRAPKVRATTEIGHTSGGTNMQALPKGVGFVADDTARLVTPNA